MLELSSSQFDPKRTLNTLPQAAAATPAEFDKLVADETEETAQGGGLGAAD